MTSTAYPSAPERPAKPFDLFFKSMMDAHAGDSNFDRQSCAENYRQEWKTMKPKKKAKWIKKAAENFRDYEEKVGKRKELIGSRSLFTPFLSNRILGSSDSEECL